jgi:DNA-binding NarL/FixJ family response regulator
MVDLTKMPQDWHPDRRRDWSALTATECRVLEARSRGLGNRGTAEVTGLPLESVKYCLRNAARVLGAKDATHAVAEALRQGLIK